MQIKRRAIMVGATFFLAAATGHLMQNGTPFIGGSPAQKPDATELAALDLATDMEPVAITPLAGSSTTVIAPDLAAKPKLVAPMAKLTPEPMPVPSAQPMPAPKADPVIGAAPVVSCTPSLSLVALDAAMVGLTLNAPCHSNARVVIRHSGLAVTAVTSDSGMMTAAIPAMAQAAHFSVVLADGALAEADIAVPALAGFDRLAVQWQGDDAFQLHAFEFGADYGDAGHVSAGRPRTPGFAKQATGGFLSLLGDDTVLLPMLAEVYTFPSGRSQRQGVVRLSIEAEVSAATCGRDMLGETLEAHAGLPVKIVDLMLAMPGCDTIGDFVVLKNLLPDVKIARN